MLSTIGQEIFFTLCNRGQPPQVSFIYTAAGFFSDITLLSTTDLDGWNILTHLEAKVEFKSCNYDQHPLESAVPILYNTGFYPHFHRIKGHTLLYRSVISGLVLQSIYANIRKTHSPAGKPAETSKLPKICD